MTKQQVETLRIIGQSREGLTRSELRSKLGIPRSSASAQAARLVSAGLVLDLDPSDGTSNRLYLSETGKARIASSDTPSRLGAMLDRIINRESTP